MSKGRPHKAAECLAKTKRARLSLTNPIPEWLVWADVQVLIREYLGRGFSRRTWARLIAEKKIRAHQDPFSGRGITRFRWQEVKADIDRELGLHLHSCQNPPHRGR